MGRFLGVDFDHLIADAESLYSGAFKMALLQHSGSSTSETSEAPCVFDEFARAVSGSSFIRQYAQLVCGRSWAPVAAAVEKMVFENESTCKPRPGSLEKLLAASADFDFVCLWSGNTDLAGTVWQTWMTLLDADLQSRFEKCFVCTLEELFMAGPTDHLTLVCSHGIADQFKDLNMQIVSRFALPEHCTHSKVASMEIKSNCPFTAGAWQKVIPIPPQVVQGVVIHGFKRGSAELGCPTANVGSPLAFQTPSKSNSQTNDLALFPVPGTYIGRCVVDVAPFQQTLLGCIVSVGWSPYYNNRVPTIEAHIYHEFSDTFYGRRMILEITGLLRGESRYVEFSELVAAIQLDCEQGWKAFNEHLKTTPCVSEIQNVLTTGWPSPDP